VYPNPVKDVLTVDVGNYDKKYEIKIFNSIGTTEKIIKGNQAKMQVNLTDLPNGTYFMRIVTDKKRQSLMILKIN
jgi:hypothetical protein